jgi:hypothetical protein
VRPSGYELDKLPLLIPLQILAKQIIVGIDGEIAEHELNSLFVYLRYLVQHLSPPESGMVVRSMPA